MLAHNKSPLTILSFLKVREQHKLTRRTFTQIAQYVGHPKVREWLDTLLHRGLITEERYDRTVAFKLTDRGREVPGPVTGAVRDAAEGLSMSARILLCAIGLHSAKSWTFLDYCAEADKATFGVITDAKGRLMSTSVKNALTELRTADLVGTLDTLSLTLKGEAAYLVTLVEPDFSNFFGPRLKVARHKDTPATGKATPTASWTASPPPVGVIVPGPAKSPGRTTAPVLNHVLVDFSVKFRMTRTADALFVATCGENEQGGVVLGEIRGLALPTKPLQWAHFGGASGTALSEQEALSALLKDVTQGMLTPAIAQGIHGVTHVTV